MEISEALKNIRYGYIAALVSAGITVVLNFLQFDAGDVNLFSDPVVLYDVIIILLLAFGIYKKSRVCAMFNRLVKSANFYPKGDADS